jgi:hypothetical protein
MRRLLLGLTIITASLLGPPVYADNGQRCNEQGRCYHENPAPDECRKDCGDQEEGGKKEKCVGWIAICGNKFPDLPGQPAQPASLFPPNPAKIGEYIGAGFQIGLDFAKALTDVIVTFIGSIGKFLA